MHVMAGHLLTPDCVRAVDVQGGKSGGYGQVKWAGQHRVSYVLLTW
jgi:hypothetical protein